MRLKSPRGFSGLTAFALLSVFAGTASSLLWGVCGPFTDVTDAAFCPFVLEIFTLGITTGTTPTTYDPTSSVSRLQMAAFLSRTVDGALRRGGRRASLDQFWTTQTAAAIGLTTVGGVPGFVASDGADLWVANQSGASVVRVRASDGKLLGTWTGATGAYGVLVAMGQVFATGDLVPGKLYRIDPSQPAGAVTTVATNLGGDPQMLVFDGARIWTGNGGGSVSIVTPGATLPWTVTTVTTGFSAPLGAVYDGSNVWVADEGPNKLFKLDSAGAILQTVSFGSSPIYPGFDGGNIWVPLNDVVAVVRASSGAVLATLTGNGLSGPQAVAFDGQRVLVTNFSNSSVSLWKAADLTPIGNFPAGGPSPIGACSDGVNFWIALSGSGLLARF